MIVQRSRLTPLLALLGAVAVAAGGRATADERPARLDFSGAWALKEAPSTEALDVRVDPSRAGGGRRGGEAGPTGVAEVPWELLVDDSRLSVVDDGITVRITPPNGKVRVFFLDGEERELDGGDGPAKVTAKRKGSRGEQLIVTVDWPSGRQRKETWLLRAEPRQLLLSARVKDRRSFHYERVYEPTTEVVKEAAPAPTATAVAGPVETRALPAPVPPAGLKACSIRPPRASTPVELTRLVKVTQSEASAKAVAYVAPVRPTSVISSDAEIREGCLVWSFVMRFPDRKGTAEIIVDAGDGRVLAADNDEN